MKPLATTAVTTSNASETALWKLRALIFGLCFCYWIYLFFSSQMVMAMDALSYEKLGHLIAQEGWAGYLKDGPTREPFYPFLISISMKIAARVSLPYGVIQKIVQILFLFITQLLTFSILRRLKVREFLKLVTVLYIGFSPAIVNSVFSLFSEVVSLPFVLAIVLLSAVSWEMIPKASVKQSFALGSLSSVLFLGAVSGRGTFQLVFYTFTFSYFCLFFYHFLKKEKRAALNAVVYVLISIFVFQSGMIFYKSLNRKYSGQYEFTDRYPRMLYGNADKRAKKLTFPIFFAHIASIPGHGFCRIFFDEQECRYCEFETVDDIYGYELPKLLVGITVPEERKQKTMALAKERIWAHPFQYILFTGIEFLRIFFWESGQLGYVNYPAWLTALFNFNLFNNGVRLIVSGLSLISVFFLAWLVYRNRKILINPAQESFSATIIVFFIVLLVFSYGGAYALFSILTRYALPIAPVFLISVAYFIEKILSKNR